MSNFDDNLVDEIKLKNDIVEVISQYVDLKGNHDSYKGLCPFHSEKTPSFTVNEKKQFFKCFGCGEGGDVISFIMKKENMDFVEALKYLAEKANIPWNERNFSKEDMEKAKEREVLLKLHVDAARYYFSNLWRNQDNSLQYLQNRGLSNQIIKRFGIGYIPPRSNLQDHLMQLGYSQENLLHSGLFVKGAKGIKDRFFGRVIFPIFDIRGRVIGFGGRVLNEGMPKYLNSSETGIFHKKENLYGLNLAKNNRENGIILVEGYMDVISLHQSGFSSAVASLGTALSTEQAQLIKKYVNRVYIAYDSDEAGIKATLKAIDIFKNIQVYPYIVTLGEFKDPDELISKKGINEFQYRIDNAIPFIQFINETIQKKYNLTIDQQQIEFIREISKELSSHKNAVEVEKEIIRIAALTGISIKAIGTQIYGEFFSPKQFEKNSNQPMRKQILKKEDIPLAITESLEKEILFLYNLTQNHEYLKMAVNTLEPEDFENVRTQKIFKDFMEKFIHNDEINLSLEGNNIQYHKIPQEQMIGMMNSIQKNSIRLKIKLLQEKQEHLDFSNLEEQKQILSLGVEITNLNKKLKEI